MFQASCADRQEEQLTRDEGEAGSGARAAFGRTARFAGGFVVGVAAIPLVVGGGFVVLGLGLMGIQNLSPSIANAIAPAAFWTSGVDVSQAGGANVIVERDGEVTRQTCRGRCDDLVYWSGAVDRVEVRAADGHRLLQSAQHRRLGLFREDKRLGLGGDPLTLNEGAGQ